MSIIVPIVAVTVIGLICAVGLSVASAVMAVKEDERFPAIRECLPGANCGACGFSGCDGYAKALLKPGTKTNLCVPGADTVAAKLSKLLGVEAEDVVEQVACVRCGGTCEHTQPKEEYHGIRTCAAARLFFSGSGSCAYGCIGMGDCAAACPQNAIYMEKGIAVVDTKSCIGCGLCAKACPQGVIAMMPDTSKTEVLCSSHDPGALTHRLCTAGCIACRKCEKACESGAITVTGNLARIDRAKCTGCGKCAEVCTTGAITARDFSGAHRFETPA